MGQSLQTGSLLHECFCLQLGNKTGSSYLENIFIQNSISNIFSKSNSSSLQVHSSVTGDIITLSTIILRSVFGFSGDKCVYIAIAIRVQLKPRQS